MTLGPYFKVFEEYVAGFDATSAHLTNMRENYPLLGSTLDQLREVSHYPCPAQHDYMR